MSFVLALVVPAIVFGIVWSIRQSRIGRLRSLNLESRGPMTLLTQDLFATAPTASADQQGSCIEGTRDGVSISVRASYDSATSSRFMRTGYESGIGARMSISVSLAGARRSFSATSNHKEARLLDPLSPDATDVRDFDFRRVWTVRGDEVFVSRVLTPALRVDLMRLESDVGAKVIRIDATGLTIEWNGDPVPLASWGRDEETQKCASKRESDRISKALEIALRLRAQIMAIVEQSAGTSVRVAGFRGADNVEESSDPSAIEASAASRSQIK